MLARVMDYHLSPARPFHGGVVEHPYPAPLGTDMHQAFEMGVLLSGREERHFEDVVVQLDTGDMWLCCAWEPHGWRALAAVAGFLIAPGLAVAIDASHVRHARVVGSDPEPHLSNRFAAFVFAFETEV